MSCLSAGLRAEPSIPCLFIDLSIFSYYCYGNIYLDSNTESPILDDWSLVTTLVLCSVEMSESLVLVLLSLREGSGLQEKLYLFIDLSIFSYYCYGNIYLNSNTESSILDDSNGNCGTKGKFCFSLQTWPHLAIPLEPGDHAGPLLRGDVRDTAALGRAPARQPYRTCH